MKKLFEEYVESADYKISVFFKELSAQIIKWFTEGSLGAQGCELDGTPPDYDDAIEISNYNPMEKFLIFNFFETEGTGSDSKSYKYRVIFMIRLDQMKGDDAQAQQAQPPAQGAPPAQPTPAEGKQLEINKVLLKIHQFNDDKEMAELVEEVKVEDIKEDFMIDKIGQLKDKSGKDGVDENDLKDEVHEQ